MAKIQFPKLQKRTLVDDFIIHFEKMILSGKLAIGEKLPSERDLAASLGVSRPVVHEGLIDLAAKGLVTRSSNGGAVINDYRKDGSLSMLTSLLRMNDGELENKLAVSTMEFRMLVEVEFARVAALNRTKEQLDEMRSILVEEKEVDRKDYESIANIDFRLHHLVAIATNNIFYPLLLNSFKDLYLNATFFFFSNETLVQPVFDFHIELIDAIAKKDDQAAVDVMKRLLEHGRINYLKMVSEAAVNGGVNGN
ncbi:MAG: FadR family transcriptional regulator [Anaerolineales bacterium]|nr:FadR family transcriptional regulator [Anaerolineales bacterium]